MLMSDLLRAVQLLDKLLPYAETRCEDLEEMEAEGEEMSPESPMPKEIRAWVEEASALLYSNRNELEGMSDDVRA